MLNRRRFVMTVTPIAVLLPACASSGGSAARGRDPDALEAEELAQHAQDSLDDVIRRLRGNWLRARGGSIGGTDPVQVYVAGAKFGDAQVLRDIAVRDVLRVDYLSGPDATTRFGTGNGGGAILVTMR